MINEVASWLNGEHHVFLQNSGSAEGAVARQGEARWVILQVSTHVMHIQPQQVAQTMWLEHCPKVGLGKHMH